MNLIKNPEMQKELLTLIASNTLLSSIALLINVIVINIAFWNITSNTFLLFWFFTIFGLSTLRYTLSKSYLNKTTKLSTELLSNYFKIISIGISVSVSVGVVVILPIDMPFHQAFLSMIVAGLSAGAVMSLSYYPNMIKAYLVILVVPFSYVIYLQDSQLHTLIAFLQILFLFMLIMFSKRYHLSIIGLILSEKKVRHQAFYDNLTGLANRATFNNHLEQQLSRLSRHKHFGAVIFIDLDHFKTINDSLGHHIGDLLLKTFASRTSSVIRKEDTVARLGGDEFVILLSDLSSEKLKTIELASIVATKLHILMKEPIKCEKHSLNLTLSIGITIIGDKDISINDIIKHADIAMYEAKSAGRDTTKFFEKEMSDKIQKELLLDTELHDAMVNDEFELYYQPIVETQTSKIVSCEALIRWNHPTKGLIFPDAFIPHAEQNNLILDIGDWVIDRACKDYVNNKDTLKNISINISKLNISFLEEKQ